MKATAAPELGLGYPIHARHAAQPAASQTGVDDVILVTIGRLWAEVHASRRARVRRACRQDRMA